MPRSAPPPSSYALPILGVLLIFGLVVALEKPWNIDFDPFSPPQDRYPFHRFVEVWIWMASVLNMVLAVLLVATRSWWIKEAVDGSDSMPEAPAKVPVHQWFLLGLSVATAASSGLPRLSHSLWGDEQIAFIGSVAGAFSHEVGTDRLESSLDRIYWADATWEDAFWQYETTNPHFLCNLGSKLTLTLWQKSRGDEPWIVHEPALRLLPFLAGLAALGAWFRLGWRSGTGRATGWGCLLLALHPWFIRHLTEARGYPFVFLLLPLVLMALRHATRDPRWRNWIFHGVLGGLLVYSWPGMLVTWICLNGAAILGNTARVIRPSRFPTRRLVLTNILLGMILLTLVAPCFAQIGPYLRENATRLPLDAPWLRDLAARLLLGIDWHDHGAYSQVNSDYITFESLWRSPLLASLLLITVAGGTFGLVRGCSLVMRKGGVARRQIGAIGVSALLIYLFGAISGTYLFPWYFVFLLPGLVLLSVKGLATSGVGRKWSRIPVALVFGAYAALALRETAALRARSEDPRRESVLATRGTLDPMDRHNSGILTAHVGTTALAYDPLGWFLEESPEPGQPGLPALMRMADVLNRELLVNVGYPANARAESPTIMGLIDKSGFFERLQSIHGLEPQFEREIYRYKGGMFVRFRKSPNN